MALIYADENAWDGLSDDERTSIYARYRSLAEEARAVGVMQGGDELVQAAIAELHTQDMTDWAQIARLYERLLAYTPSPVVELNRAVAVAFADGPEHGLELLDAISELEEYHLFHAARADLLRRLERSADAANAYRAALALTTNEAERRFLTRRLREVGSES